MPILFADVLDYRAKVTQAPRQRIKIFAVRLCRFVIRLHCKGTTNKSNYK